MIQELAARQHGLITHTQLLGCGFTRDAVRSRVRSGRFVRIHRGVYRIGPVTGARAREMAALLACGDTAAVSHRSAAVAWALGMDPDASAPADVAVPYGCARGAKVGVRVHRMRDLRPEDLTDLDGLRITRVARTLYDLATCANPRELRRAFAIALRDHADARAELLDLLSRNPRRRGARILRAMLQDEVAPAVTRSAAEERLLRLIRAARLSRPEVNVRIDGYEVDFVWRAQRLVLEVDGFAYHSSRTRFETDRLRDADLMARGFQVMRVTWRQLEREPEAFVVRLAQALLLSTPARG
jgi:very-short-patch-repair endonuclease